MVRLILLLLAIQFSISAWSSEEEECVDGVHNLVTLNSDEGFPVIVKDVTVHFYHNDMTPACHKGKVNVQIPGKAVVSGGTITLTKDLKYDDAHVLFTFTKDSWHICEKGEGTGILVPNFFCAPTLTRCLSNSMVKLNFLKKMDKEGIYNALEITDSAVEIGEMPWLLNFLGVVKGVYKMKLVLKTDEELVSLDIPTVHVGY